MIMPGSKRHSGTVYDDLYSSTAPDVSGPSTSSRYGTDFASLPVLDSLSSSTPPSPIPISSGSVAPSPVSFAEIASTTPILPPSVAANPIITPLRDHQYSSSTTPTTSRKNAPVFRRSTLKDADISNILEWASDEEDQEEDLAMDGVILNRGRQIPLDGTYDEEPIPEMPSPEVYSRYSALSPEVISLEADQPLNEPVDKYVFKWSPYPAEPVSPLLRRETFNEVSGPIETYGSPYDAFVAIWDKPLMLHIVLVTNKYAQHLCEEKNC
ncbi:uncharacterized protein LOC142985876 [Anticarsia gemmatalis]|uniref:uncharacterized protein LOC142985876 n=1 Tax=Anticarsia gemmatalis TaxID=129554 RepID=UPI003F7764E1